MRDRHLIRGGALGSTFLVIILLVLFGFTLANLATFDLRVVNRAGERQMAFEAAEAGLSRATAAIAENPDFGLNDEVLQQTLPDGSSYLVTFDDDATVEWSLNNLPSLSGESGWGGRAVPPHHVLLFAHGTSPAGETVLLESLIRLEALPYAVAGTNKVSLVTTQVAGAYTSSQYDNGIQRAGHVYSGSSDSDSLTISLLSSVSGDARSVGGIDVLASTVVGDVDDYESPENLPAFTISSFDNSSAPGVDLRPGGPQVNPVLAGQVYIDGDATFAAPVVLNDAVVYVRGDLNVLTVVGRGTFFVEGETNFLVGGVNMAGSDKLTLFSQGDIHIPLGGVFQGVLLTQGDFNAGAALVLRGAVYANATDPTKGNVNLGAGSVVVHIAEFTSLASYWLGLGGEAQPLQVYWNRVR